MKFVCDNCSSRYFVDDKKVAGKTVHVRCKRCGNVIKVRGPRASAPAKAEPTSPRQPLSTGAQSRIAHQARSGSVPGAVAPRAPRVDWHYSVGGRSFGPFNEDDLLAKFLSGQVGDDAYVWNAGLGDWRPAYDVPKFAPAIEQARRLHPSMSPLGRPPEPAARVEEPAPAQPEADEATKPASVDVIAASPQREKEAREAEAEPLFPAAVAGVTRRAAPTKPSVPHLEQSREPQLSSGAFSSLRIDKGEPTAPAKPKTPDDAPRDEALERLRSLRQRLLGGGAAPSGRTVAKSSTAQSAPESQAKAPREPALSELSPASEAFPTDAGALSLSTRDFEALRISEKERTYTHDAVTTVEPPAPETLEELRRDDEPEPAVATPAETEPTEETAPVAAEPTQPEEVPEPEEIPEPAKLHEPVEPAELAEPVELPEPEELPEPVEASEPEPAAEPEPSADEQPEIAAAEVEAAEQPEPATQVAATEEPEPATELEAAQELAPDIEAEPAAEVETELEADGEAAEGPGARPLEQLSHVEEAFFSDDRIAPEHDDFGNLEVESSSKKPDVDTRALAQIKTVQKHGRTKRWAGVGILAAAGVLAALFIPSLLDDTDQTGTDLDSLVASAPASRTEPTPIPPAPTVDANLSTLNLTAAVNLALSEVHRATSRGYDQLPQPDVYHAAAEESDQAGDGAEDPGDDDVARVDETDRERSTTGLRNGSLVTDDGSGQRIAVPEGSGGPSIFTRLSGRTVNIDREPTALEIEAEQPREHSTALSADYFDEDLEQVRRAVQRCHELQLREASGVQFARVVLDFSVEPNGRVSITMDDQLAGSTFGRCLQTRYTTWSFRTFEGETVTLQRTYALQ